MKVLSREALDMLNLSIESQHPTYAKALAAWTADPKAVLQFDAEDYGQRPVETFRQNLKSFFERKQMPISTRIRDAGSSGAVVLAWRVEQASREPVGGDPPAPQSK